MAQKAPSGVSFLRHKTASFLSSLYPPSKLFINFFFPPVNLYYKENLKVTLDGKRRTAMVYIMNGNSHPYSPPARSYMRTILEGYESAGFDPGILYRAAGESITAGDIFPDMGKEKHRKGGAGR